MIELLNIDCLEYMKGVPDKYFELAIVDPPYGIKAVEWMGKDSGNKRRNAATKKGVYAVKDWDKEAPDENYFDELMRVSKNQIIWGANYMVEFIPPSMGWVIWDKDNGDNGFSDGELAFTSFNKGIRKVKITWNGMLQHDMKNKEERIHPTQKPVKLYKWLLHNYAKPGDNILDTHGGSRSLAIACYEMGFDHVSCEIDKDYHDNSVKRFKQQTMQQSLFK